MKALITLACCIATPAFSLCTGAEDFRKAAKSWGEALVMQGLSIQGTLVEVFVNSENKKWTIVSTTIEGQTCVVTVGNDFNLVEELDDAF